MTSRKTLDIDFITLRKIRAVDPLTNALITPNFILAMDNQGQAQWVNTLSNINTYGGVTGFTGPTGPVNQSAMVTLTAQSTSAIPTIPSGTPTAAQFPTIDLNNSTATNFGITWNTLGSVFTNTTELPLQVLLTWQIGWNQLPGTKAEYQSLTTYTQVNGSNSYGYQTNDYGLGDIKGNANPSQTSSCVVLLDPSSSFSIYVDQINNAGCPATINSTSKLIMTLVQTGPQGPTGVTGPTGPTGAGSLLLTDNFMVAGGTDPTNNVGYSYDGLNWNTSSSGSSLFTTICTGLAWNGALWIGGGQQDGSGIIGYSSDGINWNDSSSGNSVFVDSQCNCVAWNGSLWVAGGGFQGLPAINKIVYSYDGITWTPSPSGNALFTDYGGQGSCNTVVWNGTVWVAGGSPHYNGNNTSMVYSYDGINWIKSVSGTNVFNVSCNSIAWNGSFFIGGGNWSSNPGNNQGIGQLGSSSDGINWTDIPNNIFNNNINVCQTVAWNGSLWVAGGIGSSSIAYSSDGQTWYPGDNTNIFGECNSVAWNGSVWIAGGSTPSNIGVIAYSTDAINWTISSSGSSLFSTSCNALASRRPLPYVGETVVPPILHQATGPTGGAVVFTSPTGTNNMYYSRFLSVTESDGTGTLGINGSVQIGPTGTISADVSGNLILNTSLLPATGYAYDLGSTGMPWNEVYVGTGSVHIGPTGTLSADQSGNIVISVLNGLYLLDLSGNIVSQVYDTNFNVPAGEAQTLSQSGNNVTLSGGGSVNIGQTTDVSNNTYKLIATSYTPQSGEGTLDITNFTSSVVINKTLDAGHPIKINNDLGSLKLDVDTSGNASIFPEGYNTLFDYSNATTSIGCVSSPNAVKISRGIVGGQPVDRLVVGATDTSGILLQGPSTIDKHGYIRMNSTTGTEVLSLGAGGGYSSQITLDRASGSVTINGPTTTTISGTSTAINTTNTTIGGSTTIINSPTTINNNLTVGNSIINSNIVTSATNTGQLTLGSSTAFPNVVQISDTSVAASTQFGGNGGNSVYIQGSGGAVGNTCTIATSATSGSGQGNLQLASSIGATNTVKITDTSLNVTGLTLSLGNPYTVSYSPSVVGDNNPHGGGTYEFLISSYPTGLYMLMLRILPANITDSSTFQNMFSTLVYIEQQGGPGTSIVVGGGAGGTTNLYSSPWSSSGAGAAADSIRIAQGNFNTFYNIKMLQLTTTLPGF